MPALTVEFHSVSTGLGLGYPHPNQRRCSIVVSSLTAGIHSVWHRRESSDSHPSRRTRLIVCRHAPSKFQRQGSSRSGLFTPELDALVRARAVPHRQNSQGLGSSRSGLFTPELAPLFERAPPLTIEIHSVSSRRGAGCPHPNRHPCSSARRHSPSKFTVFRVVAERAVRTRIDTRVRARADAHRRNSQRFECPRAAISTPVPAVSFDCPTGCTKAGPTCGYPAAESTHDPVHPEGEGDHRSGEAGMRRCGYLLPASTRRAVDFNGERRNPLELRTD